MNFLENLLEIVWQFFTEFHRQFLLKFLPQTLSVFIQQFLRELLWSTFARILLTNSQEIPPKTVQDIIQETPWVIRIKISLGISLR